MRSAPTNLVKIIAEELAQPVAPDVEALATALERDHGASMKGVIFYGSCLRDRTLDDRIADFYLLVGSYRAFYSSWWAAAGNAALPPNVFYYEAEENGKVLRAKVAVISLEDLARGTTSRSFLSYLWGRFAQPVRLLRPADKGVSNYVATALGSAVVTLLRRGLPLMPTRFTSAQIWQTALAESYRTELRAERRTRADELVERDAERYERLTRAVTEGRALPGARRRGDGGFEHQPSGGATVRCKIGWTMRRLAGKALHVLRLVKAAFTFENGLEYLLWKIQRHSGETVEVKDWQRRHPLLAAPGLALRLYRRGAFR